MNQDPRVVLEFYDNQVDYRLVYNGAAYVIQARNRMYVPHEWQTSNYGFEPFCKYVENKLLRSTTSTDAKDDA